MAETLDDKQLSELSAFMNALAELGGYKSNAQWARDSGVQRPNLTNARNGKKGISGYNLLRLIAAVAARAEISQAEAAARASAGGDALENLDRRLSGVVEALSRLELLTEHSLGAVEVRLGRIDERLELPARTETGVGPS